MIRGLLVLGFALLTTTLVAQKYKVTYGKGVGWYMIAAGSFVDGFTEGYVFQGRRYFERNFRASDTGFFGSRSYERRFTHPNIWNRTMGVFDFYHVADDARKILYIGGGVTLGLSATKRPLKHLVIDTGIAFVFSSIFKSIGLSVARINLNK